MLYRLPDTEGSAPSFDGTPDSKTAAVINAAIASQGSRLFGAPWSSKNWNAAVWSIFRPMCAGWFDGPTTSWLSGGQRSAERSERSATG